MTIFKLYDYEKKENGCRAITNPCPFGVRDLENDECYSGGGNNRCQWFVRYDYPYVVCKHPAETKSADSEPVQEDPLQLRLF